MKLHRKIAKVFGYELIKRKRHPTLNSHVINLINHYRIDLVLDVGANYGQYGNMLRNEQYKGEIHSFEPVSTVYENLHKACLNDKKRFNYKLAVGAACGEKTINVMRSPDLSSFRDLSEFGEGRTVIAHKETVKVETIDSFLSAKIKDFEKRRIFLKMDTQGYDLEVFKGALNSIKYIVCIQSEISLTHIYSNVPHYLELLKIFEKYGFMITGLYPVGRNKNLSLIEMDCVLVNSKNS